jgi:hypothetical protein
MEDYSNLKGSGSVAPLSERIWGVQKKGKTGDRNPQNGKRHEREKAAKEPLESGLEQLESPGEEPVWPEGEEGTGYGTLRSRKKSSRQVDLII